MMHEEDIQQVVLSAIERLQDDRLKWRGVHVSDAKVEAMKIGLDEDQFDNALEKLIKDGKVCSPVLNHLKVV